MKWNESGFRPLLCTYRLNWARRTSWGWWDDWDDTVLQTQDSKFEPWRSEAEHATSRSRRLPTILTFTRGWGRNIFVSLKPPRPGTEPRTLAWKAAVLTTTLGPPPPKGLKAFQEQAEADAHSVGSMLGQRQTHWPSIEPELGRCITFVRIASPTTGRDTHRAEKDGAPVSDDRCIYGVHQTITGLILGPSGGSGGKDVSRLLMATRRTLDYRLMLF